MAAELTATLVAGWSTYMENVDEVADLERIAKLAPVMESTRDVAVIKMALDEFSFFAVQVFEILGVVSFRTNVNTDLLNLGKLLRVTLAGFIRQIVKCALIRESHL